MATCRSHSIAHLQVGAEATKNGLLLHLLFLLWSHDAQISHLFVKVLLDFRETVGNRRFLSCLARPIVQRLRRHGFRIHADTDREAERAHRVCSSPICFWTARKFSNRSARMCSFSGHAWQGPCKLTSAPGSCGKRNKSSCVSTHASGVGG
jgi:hypothetical protein